MNLSLLMYGWLRMEKTKEINENSTCLDRKNKRWKMNVFYYIINKLGLNRGEGE